MPTNKELKAHIRQYKAEKCLPYSKLKKSGIIRASEEIRIYGKHTGKYPQETSP